MLLLILLASKASSSSIYVPLGVPYHQISGNVRIESYSYAPFSTTWEGITKVYYKGKFLYSIGKYFSDYIAVSKDGKNFYEIYFRFKDEVAIYHYRNGVKINEIKPAYIENLLQKTKMIDYYFWSLFHEDAQYRKNKLDLSMSQFDGKFKNIKIKKIPQFNETIFVHENSLYIKSLEDKFVILNLSTGVIEAKNGNYLLPSSKNSKKSEVYRNVQKYDILGNGKFPVSKNHHEAFAIIVKKILVGNELFGLSNYKGQLKLYFSIKLKNNGLIDDIGFLSLDGDGFMSSYEQNLFLAETLRKTKFSTKNIPKGSEYLTFTSWGGVSAHPILIDL